MLGVAVGGVVGGPRPPSLELGQAHVGPVGQVDVAQQPPVGVGVGHAGGVDQQHGAALDQVGHRRGGLGVGAHVLFGGVDADQADPPEGVDVDGVAVDDVADHPGLGHLLAG